MSSCEEQQRWTEEIRTSSPNRRTNEVTRAVGYYGYGQLHLQRTEEWWKTSIKPIIGRVRIGQQIAVRFKEGDQDTFLDPI
ncbi:hypothetical protein ABVT39_006510, partial [Epinephelus coioides]